MMSQKEAPKKHPWVVGASQKSSLFGVNSQPLILIWLNILYNTIAVAPDKVTPGFLDSDLIFEYTKEEEEEVLPLISKELIFYCNNGNPMPTIKIYLGK